MRVQTLVRKLKKLRPKSRKDLRRAKIKYRFLDSGVFRQVFVLIDVEPKVVIKLPNANAQTDSDSDMAVRHGLNEMLGFSRLRKTKWAQPHLPKIYYEDQENGVIVMKKYKINGDDEKLESRLHKFFGLDSDDTDYGAGNFGTEKGRTIILDLGIN